MDIYTFLEEHHIPYQRFDHPPVYTVEQANRLAAGRPGEPTKNLFLRDKKGTRHFLLVCRDDLAVDLNQLAKRLGVSRLSLGSAERLMAHLGVEPGAVSLLGLVNDAHQRVEVLIDRALWEAEAIQSHPLVNTATLTIPMDGIREFLKATGHTVRLVDLEG